MQEETCSNPQCRHSRRMHSIQGCTHTRKNMKACNCKITFMEKQCFPMGTPKDD